jgi:hypothetical protein
LPINAHLPFDGLMALSKIEGRRCSHPSQGSDKRRVTSDKFVFYLVTCYSSLVTKTRALYLSVFEQPAGRVSFSILLELI